MTTGNLTCTTLTVSGAVTTGTLTCSGLLTASAGATVASGQTLTLTGATVAGTPTWSSSQAITLSTVAQPNITSVGTLTSLTTGQVGVTATSGSAIQVKTAAVSNWILQGLKHGTDTTIAGFYEDSDGSGTIAASTAAGAQTITIAGATGAITAGAISGTTGQFSGAIIMSTTATPTGAGTGVVGQIAWDTAYLYICTAVNDWRRIALVDF